MRKSSWLPWLLAVAILSPASGQRARIAGPPFGSPLLASRASQDSVPRAVIHNWQGPALIGGALLGTVTQLGVFGLCTDAETATGSCVVAGEEGFLFGGVIGGLTAALIGSSPKPQVPPRGMEFHGDHRVYGALMLGVPSLAVNVLGMRWYCRHTDGYFITPSGCSVGNFLAAALGSGLNALIGYWLGKAIPGVRDEEKP